MNGNQIRDLRVSMGLTQEEFAHRLGVTLCTVNRWENNKVAPSRLAVRQLQQISNLKASRN
jgi:DNA-binding transcriptional regulator YiaG